MANYKEAIEEEFRLARQMKNDCCDKSGKETDIPQSAEIIHKIAVSYRIRSPDKISLIKSVGLINAAIIRNPSNIIQIKSDLIEICQHILQLSKAKNQNADLKQKADQVKTSMNKLRKEVDEFLEKSVPKVPSNIAKEDIQKLISHKISAIQHLNKTIASKYKQIMADLSQFCEDVMGKPPCKYAIAGMGSLAREEITPYSDFEHIILLFDDKNYQSHLEYFRWFSVIFHVIILNVQESIIPSLNVNSLNGKDSKLGDWYYDDITPRGISFDGMMSHACKFPLGRMQHTKSKLFTTELIKPVSQMLEYLSSEADLKNGYHLADILTKTCFVFGNKDIFKQFAVGVQDYQDKKSKADTINNIQHQVKDDLNSFSTRFRLSKLKSQDKINIKQLVYRSTTIFIAAMASLYNISANSCFDIIDKMAQNNKISQNTAEKLQYTIAIACEMRLRVYMKMKSQCDNAIDLRQTHGIENFLDIVGVTCTISYFQIAYCLQCEIAKQLNFTKLHFYSDPQLINFTIGLAFNINNLASFSKNPKNQIWDFSKFDFDACIEQLEKENSWSLVTGTAISKTTTSSSSQSKLNVRQIETVANYLFSAQIFDEAIEFYKQLLEVYQKKSKNNKLIDVVERNAEKSDTAEVLRNAGICHRNLHNYKDALSFFNQALEIYQNITLDAKKDNFIATMLDIIGICHLDLCNYSEALGFFNRALEIKQNRTLNIDKDRDLARTLNNIGQCHICLQKFNDASLFLNRALKIYQNITHNAQKDRNIAVALDNIGRCYMDSSKHDIALPYLNRSLEIKQNITLNADRDSSIATTLNNIGICHRKLHNCKDALTFLNRSNKIYQNKTLLANRDENIAATLNNIALCHMDLHNCNDALTFLNQALEIQQNTTLNFDKDNSFAKTLKNIGICYMFMQNYNDALAFLNRALKIYQNTTLNAKKDKDIGAILNNIGICYMNCLNLDNSLEFLNRALEISQNRTLNAEKDEIIAKLLHNIGLCLKELCNYDDALSFLTRALAIYQNIAVNPTKDSSIAKILNMIGVCHARLHNYSDALTFINRAHGIFQNVTMSVDKDRNIAMTLDNIAACHMGLFKFDKALTFLERAHEICQNTTLNLNRDRDLAEIQTNIGRCLSALQKFDESWNYLQHSRKVFQDMSPDQKKDCYIAVTYNNMGECLLGKQQFANALTYLQQALEIYQASNRNAQKDAELAQTTCNIALCLMELQEYANALNYWKQSLKIYENIQLNAYVRNKITFVSSKIEACLLKLD